MHTAQALHYTIIIVQATLNKKPVENDDCSSRSCKSGVGVIIHNPQVLSIPLK